MNIKTEVVEEDRVPGSEEVYTPPEDAEPVELPTEAPEDAEPNQAWIDFDFAAWDGENIEDVPEQLRGAASYFQTQLQAARQRIADAEGKAEYHEGMWQEVLKNDDATKYKALEDQLASQKSENEKLKEALVNKDSDLAKLRTEFEQHTTVSNQQYLGWVEEKWKEELLEDAKNGAPVLDAIETLAVEAGVDPDLGCELGFRHGTAALLEVAELLDKGMDVDDAIAFAKRLHPIQDAAPAAEPEAAPEPEPDPEASHSPAAELLDEEPQHQIPESKVKIKHEDGFSFDGDKLDSMLMDVSTSLFHDRSFHAR